MNGIGLLGQKVGMTQVYTEAGRAVPVTVLLVLARYCSLNPKRLTLMTQFKLAIKTNPEIRFHALFVVT